MFLVGIYIPHSYGTKIRIFFKLPNFFQEKANKILKIYILEREVVNSLSHGTKIMKLSKLPKKKAKKANEILKKMVSR